MIVNTSLGLSRLMYRNTIQSYNKPLVFIDVSKREYCKPSGPPGAGADKGSGAGVIKDAGGIIAGRLGAPREEGYFYNKEREKLAKLKKNLESNPDLSLKKEDK